MARKIAFRARFAQPDADPARSRELTTFTGDLKGKSTADTWFTPDHLLPVKEHVVTDATTNAGSFHSEYRAELNVDRRDERPTQRMTRWTS